MEDTVTDLEIKMQDIDYNKEDIKSNERKIKSLEKLNEPKTEEKLVDIK